MQSYVNSAAVVSDKKIDIIEFEESKGGDVRFLSFIQRKYLSHAFVCPTKGYWASDLPRSQRGSQRPVDGHSTTAHYIGMKIGEGGLGEAAQ